MRSTIGFWEIELEDDSFTKKQLFFTTFADEKRGWMATKQKYSSIFGLFAFDLNQSILNYTIFAANF